MSGKKKKVCDRWSSTYPYSVNVRIADLDGMAGRLRNEKRTRMRGRGIWAREGKKNKITSF